tara:strand:+ start:1624 stop:2001 length:378 start_codon:yes stop_codon:yes gene_type:complete
MTELVLEIPLLKPPSLNAYYAGGHWTKRKKAKDLYLANIKSFFSEYDPFNAKTFRIDLTYNSRYDCDNAIIAVKFLADSITHLNIVKDDSKKYFQEMSIKVDLSLPNDTFIAKVTFKDVDYGSYL